jgi:Domain of unknown function (DUF1854)
MDVFELAQRPIDTEELHYLDPPTIRFERAGARLHLDLGGTAHRNVTVTCAFPLSLPLRFLSVRDADNNEIGMIKDASELDAENLRIITEALERRYLMPIIQRVLRVKERFGTLDWEVITDRGLRTFTTRDLRENVVHPAPGRALLTDVDGNRYDVRDLYALDRASQAWLLRYT